MPNALYTRLMICRTPAASRADARLFALSISARAQEPRGALSTALGMSPDMLREILIHYFPVTLEGKAKETCLKSHLHGLAGQPFLCLCHDLQVEPVDENVEAEKADLRSLLLECRARGAVEELWFAHIIAAICLRPNHLWQDMGFESRTDISQLLARHFPALYAKNVDNMKWKKFFYKQLCDRAEVRMCQAPSCGVCNDYAECFGSEDVSGWTPSRLDNAAQ